MSHSTTQVTTHLFGDGVVEWKPLAQALTTGFQSCVDGRDPDAVLGTPGGDAGELLMALAVAENRIGTPLAEPEVAALLGGVLTHFGTFYMHTDSHAMHVLADALAKDASFADVAGNHAAVEALVRNPGDRADALLAHLTVPDHIGCGHLKLISKHPEDYGVRRELTAAYIRCVFRALWSGANVHYVVLQGGHAEGAVVQVNAGDTVHAWSRVPQVSPCHGNSQIFVNHPAEVGWLRRQLASFVVGQMDALAGTAAADFAADIDALAGVQLGHTLHHLANGLPVYQAQIHADGSVLVSG